MRRLLSSLIAAATVAAPAHAAGWQDQTDVGLGAFVGARIKIPLQHQADAGPQAELALAPTLTRFSSGGRTKTLIGDGLALSFGPASPPTLKWAGAPAGSLLRLSPGSTPRPGQKMGLSTGGWVAIGAGVIAVAGGLYLLHLANRCDECDD